MIRPVRLRPGGTIGVIAPSSWAKPAALARGVATLKSFGYRVKLHCRPGLKDGYLAGPDAVRARLVNAALRDRSLDAILCERGGYGMLRIVDRLDFAALARRPIPFVGFSDLTVFELALWKTHRMTSCYGPMIAFESPRFNWTHLWRMLSNPEPAGRVPVPPPFRPRFLRPGRATGRILGGTLSLVAKLVGTKWLPDLTGAILFLEDVDEKPHKLDGYLAQLRLAGILDRVAGVILANFARCAPRRKADLPLERIFRDYFGRAPYPVAVDFPFGHRDPMFTIPQGVGARLDSSTRSLTFLEPGVR